MQQHPDAGPAGSSAGQSHAAYGDVLTVLGNKGYGRVVVLTTNKAGVTRALQES